VWRKKPINMDSVIAKFIVAGNKYIWLSSTYINRGSKKNFLDVMANVKELVPEVEWPYILLCGDWNIDAINNSEESGIQGAKKKRIDVVTRVCKQMGLEVIAGGPTRKGAALDFIIAGSAVRVTDLKVVRSENESDHDILSFKLSVQAPEVSLRVLSLPNRKLANKFTINSLKKAENSLHFLGLVQSRMESKNMDISMKLKRKPFKRELLDRLLLST